ncbi:MAG: peptidoglycan-binding domain-containing protein [Candidatus Staskawiczbacteria bacterium]|jgi:hypothetical protein
MSIKKTIIATVLGLALVAAVVPAPAQGVTIDELLAQITALTAQLNALQGGSTAGTGACVGVTFSRFLTIGSTGSDVRCLQQIVGNTITGTFGSYTKAKVVTWQSTHGITNCGSVCGTVGSLTRAALNNALSVGGSVIPPVTPVVTTPGAEGSIAVTKSASPASGAELNVGTSGAVIALDVKATGSDVVMNRLDLNFDTATSGTNCNIRPWTYVQSVTVSDGTTSKEMAVTSANTLENTVGSDYTVRIEGLNMVVAKDVTKKFTATFTAVSALPAGATSCVNTVEVDANGVRATDGAGVSQYNASAITGNSFTVKTGDTGTLTVSAHTDNPKAKNVIVSETASTENVLLLKFNVEAKVNDVIVRKIYVQPYSSSTTLATTMPTLKLLDGTTEVASTSTAASATFDVTGITIPKGTTKTFSVVGTVAKTNASAVSEGDAVYANMAAADVTGEDASTFAAVTAGGSTLTGALQYAYLKAPTFAYVSSSISPIASSLLASSTPQQLSTELKFNVTAVGGDIYIRKYDSTAASSGLVSTSTSGNVAASSTIAYTFDSNATSQTYAYKISNGETKTFTVNSNSTTMNHAADMWEGTGILNIKWGTTDGNTDEDGSTVQTWGLEDLKTSQLLLKARD